MDGYTDLATKQSGQIRADALECSRQSVEDFGDHIRLSPGIVRVNRLVWRHLILSAEEVVK